MKGLGHLLLVSLLVLLDQHVRCDGYNYEDAIFEDLYKRLADLQDRGYVASPDDMEYGGPMDLKDDYLTIPLEARDSSVGMADLRDQEYLVQQSTDGFQKISGGAGEGHQHLKPQGEQNSTQEVKSDESLPFYCHPPNPCPKGFEEKDGCRSDIDDSAEFQKRWINGLMKRKLCNCDEEHMFSCPKTGDTMNTRKGHAARDKLDDVLDVLLGQNNVDQGPFLEGNKHEKLVAKKSPGMFGAAAVDNPYLSGAKIRTVAKKG